MAQIIAIRPEAIDEDGLASADAALKNEADKLFDELSEALNRYLRAVHDPLSMPTCRAEAAEELIDNTRKALKRNVRRINPAIEWVHDEALKLEGAAHATEGE